jgi:hypothetical protein
MELMNLSKITNTGKLNYHLKVLGDLIQKTADDKYSLTDRGRLAVQLLEKFPSKPIQGKPVLSHGTAIMLTPEWKREFGLMTLMIASFLGGIYLLFFSVLFLERPWPHGPISLTSAAGIIVATGLIILSFAIRKRYLAVKERNKQTLIAYRVDSPTH